MCEQFRLSPPPTSGVSLDLLKFPQKLCPVTGNFRADFGGQLLLGTHYRFFLRHELSFRPAHNRGEPLQFQDAGSLDVEDILKKGIATGQAHVSSVTLVRPGNVEGLDTAGLVVAREERMKLLIRAEPEKTLGVIKKIQNWMKTHDWKDAVVEVDMPENRKRLVSIAREADAADILFVRSEPIDVGNPLDPCTDKINEELVARAKTMFAKDSKG